MEHAINPYFTPGEVYALNDPWGFKTLRAMYDAQDRAKAAKLEAERQAKRPKGPPWWMERPPAPRPARSGGGAVVFGLGLGLGALAIALWRHFKDRKAQVSQVAGRGPVTDPVWVPADPVGLERLLATARSWLETTPQATDEELARKVWRANWPSVPFPRPPHEKDHPSLAQALQYVDAAVETARQGESATEESEQFAGRERPVEAEGWLGDLGFSGTTPASAGPEFAWTTAPEEEAAGSTSKSFEAEPSGGEPVIPTAFPSLPAPTGAWSPVAPDSEPAAVTEHASTSPTSAGSVSMPPQAELPVRTSETPTMGCFYMLDVGEDLHAVAAEVVHAAALEAAAKRGWSAEKGQARADKLAAKPRSRAAYVELLNRGQWNVERQPDADGRIKLWLPPLRVGALFDRTRRRRVVEETRPWPDGSSKLEPPPWGREPAVSS